MFQYKKASKDAPSESAAEHTSIAYVSEQTRLPIALVKNESVTLYEWKTAPQGTLAMPSNVQTLLAQRKKASDQMTKQACRPF